jgi:hypothetical protein
METGYGDYNVCHYSLSGNYYADIYGEYQLFYDYIPYNAGGVIDIAAGYYHANVRLAYY